jgi:uncharacterized protein YprB with RNaseH-like and TPR domain
VQSFDERLSRLAALRPAPRSIEAPPLGETRRHSDDDPLIRRLGAAVLTNRYGEHLAVRQWFSSPEPCQAAPDVMHFLLPPEKRRRKPRGADQPRHRIADFDVICDPMQWLFLDTETTGISGGSGTYAFLVGLAWWDGVGLQVEQFFMRDFGEEHSVLMELAKRMSDRRVLVTFNGKSFDWPLLETRYAMTRVIKPCVPLAHLDFLHPARALWKLRLGSVRLVDLERHVLDAARLGWRRDADIESAFIPQFYFDYLRGGPVEPLLGVFRHNQMDLRGLAALAGKILSTLPADRSARNSQEDALDLVALSRWVHKRGESKRAQQLYEQALSAELPEEIGRAARRELAMLVKRSGNFARANALWEELAGGLANGPQEAFQAFEQLAIFYEHREKDFQRAAGICRRTLKLLRQAKTSRWCLLDPVKAAQIEARFEHRLKRIERLGRTKQGLLTDPSAAESSRENPEANRA